MQDWLKIGAFCREIFDIALLAGCGNWTAGLEPGNKPDPPAGTVALVDRGVAGDWLGDHACYDFGLLRLPVPARGDLDGVGAENLVHVMRPGGIR